MIGIGLKVEAKSGDVLNLLFKEGAAASYKYKVHFEGSEPAKVKGGLDQENDSNSPKQMSEPNPKPPKIPKMFTDLQGKGKKDASGGATASDFLKSAPPQGSWTDIDGGKLIIYSFMDPKPSATVAAFDMDGTLITTQSGRVFPKDDRDWKFCMNITVAKLQSYWNQSQNPETDTGASSPLRIVIISNQAGLTGKAAAAVTSFKGDRKSVV